VVVHSVVVDVVENRGKVWGSPELEHKIAELVDRLAKPESALTGVDAREDSSETVGSLWAGKSRLNLLEKIFLASRGGEKLGDNSLLPLGDVGDPGLPVEDLLLSLALFRDCKTSSRAEGDVVELCKDEKGAMTVVESTEIENNIFFFPNKKVCVMRPNVFFF